MRGLGALASPSKQEVLRTITFSAHLPPPTFIACRNVPRDQQPSPASLLFCFLELSQPLFSFLQADFFLLPRVPGS